jgi:hypothetical protein
LERERGCKNIGADAGWQDSMESNNGYRQVMIWVNHSEAVVAVFVGSLPTGWLEIYGKGPHPEQIGGWLVYGVEAHSHETLKGFHQEIIQHLTPVDAILLLGLGQPKHQLAKFITEQGSHLGHIAQIDTVPRLTAAELVAYAEAFFHVELPPQT